MHTRKSAFSAQTADVHVSGYLDRRLAGKAYRNALHRGHAVARADETADGAAAATAAVSAATARQQRGALLIEQMGHGPIENVLMRQEASVFMIRLRARRSGYFCRAYEQ